MAQSASCNNGITDGDSAGLFHYDDNADNIRLACHTGADDGYP